MLTFYVRVERERKGGEDRNCFFELDLDSTHVVELIGVVYAAWKNQTRVFDYFIRLKKLER